MESLKKTQLKLADIRDTIFTDDQASKMLNKFWRPDGITIDSQNQARIRDWLDNNGLKNTFAYHEL